jgi:hypothetical protein
VPNAICQKKPQNRRNWRGSFRTISNCVAPKQHVCGRIYYYGFTHYNLKQLCQFKLQDRGLQKLQQIKIENQVTFPLPAYTEEHINKVLDFLPIEHVRGLEKIKLVDFINDPRLKNLDVPMKGDLPGLYHPRAGNQAPCAGNVYGSPAVADRRICQEVDGKEWT